MSGFFELIFKNVSLGNAIRSEVEEDLGMMVRWIPGVVGFGVRYAAYKLLFGRIDGAPYIWPHVRFAQTKGIRLGRGVVINSFTYIYGKGGVEIGDKSLISPNCSIVAGDHDFAGTESILERPSKSQKIVIENECWIGANSVIVGGVTIREGSIVGAGSVVTKDTEPFSINVGSPAKKIGDRRGRDR